MRFFVLFLVGVIASCSSDEAGENNSNGAGAQGNSQAGSGGSATSGGNASSGTGGGVKTNSGGSAGTSDSSAGTSGNGPSAEDITKACSAAGAALCARIEECSAFGLKVIYGDAATCKERFIIECRAGVEATGSSSTTAKLEACAAAVPALSCEDLIAQKLGPACSAAPGKLENDGACIDDAQCKSAFCARAPNTTCGKCSPATTEGAACVNQACIRGQACVANKCIIPKRGKAGDACNSQDECDVATGVGCNTLTKKCIPLTSAKVSEPCGAKDFTGSSYAVCEASGSCSAPLNGKCSAAAVDGATCSTATTGPACMLPARCVNGKCEVPKESACN